MSARLLLACACGPVVLWLVGCSSSGDTTPGATPVERGKTLYQALRCGRCHASDPHATDGFPLAGIYGLPATLADGRIVVRDDAYLFRALRDPRAEVVAGAAVKMPRYPKLSDEDVRDLVAYLKQLR